MTHKSTRGRIFRSVLLVTGSQMHPGFAAEMLRYDGAHANAANMAIMVDGKGPRQVTVTSSYSLTQARLATFGVRVLSVNGVPQK